MGELDKGNQLEMRAAIPTESIPLSQIPAFVAQMERAGINVGTRSLEQEREQQNMTKKEDLLTKKDDLLLTIWKMKLEVVEKKIEEAKVAQTTDATINILLQAEEILTRRT
jgi:hypothetical protein